MSGNLTAEQLNELSKETLVSMTLSMQEQLNTLNSRLDYLTGQIALANSNRFGRHTEKLSQISGQGCFDEDGEIYFNEAEAIHDTDPDPEEPTVETAVKKRTPRPKGKKEQDLGQFDVYVLPTIDVPEEELIRVFGSPDNCRRMPDEVMQRLAYIPAGWRVEETHIAVYRSRNGEAKFVKGKAPAYLLRGSIVTPSPEAAIINAKYGNAQPYRRIEKDFRQNGVCISEQNMASWTIKCAERYLSRFYNYLHALIREYHVLQADETTVEVVKDGRKAGCKSYMWIYRTGEYYGDRPIVLYEYQKTRNHEHPLNFLEGFNGYLVCDGFPGYKTLSRKAEGITIAECWSHLRRKFTDAVKAADGSKHPAQGQIAEDALQMIAAIFHAEGKLKDMSPRDRQRKRKIKVRPLIDAFFTWVHKIADDKSILMSQDTYDGIRYAINQEEHLRVFLQDGEVPMHNNCAERTIRGFTVGRRNWMTIDTISGATASAVIYSLVETARANNLHIYHYMEYLLTELPKLREFASTEEETKAMERLLPWSEELPEICHKRGR